jgi:hypothetical protein
MCSDRRIEKSNSQTTKAKSKFKKFSSWIRGQGGKEANERLALNLFLHLEKKKYFFGIDLAKNNLIFWRITEINFGRYLATFFRLLEILI